MLGRRLCYLAVFAGCIVFYIAYGQWLSWILLIAVAALPWFSLALSLPAIATFRGRPGGPDHLQQGEEAGLWLSGSSPFPMPLFRGRLRVRRLITGEHWLYQDRCDLPTGHCGGLAVTAEGLRIYDYLGLFSFPVRCREAKKLVIRPRPIPPDSHRDPTLAVPRSWRPKFGGGFAENHELRLYRPGDSLNRIHWKLSAKTGRLTIREPMEPDRGMLLLTMNLRGTPEALDKKFGNLLWLGQRLLEQDLPVTLRCLTGEGLLTFDLDSRHHLTAAIDDLLCRPAAEEGDVRQHTGGAVWHCHLGGESHDA